MLLRIMLGLWRRVTDVGERVSLITVGLASTHQSTTYKLYDYIADELMTLLFGSFFYAN